MKLIIGLGNPAEEHVRQRHNLGFMAVERFLKDFEPVKQTVWEDNKKFKSDILQAEWKPKHGDAEKIILAKPKTYMNNSGLAVSLLTTYYKLPAVDLWVIHDELDLPLGFMKIRLGGSGAGHRGVESIIQKLGTDKFWRFRLGIGTNRTHSEIGGHIIKHVDDYVLSPFGQDQMGKARELIKRTSKALQLALENGLPAAMNRYNTK